MKRCTNYRSGHCRLAEEELAVRQSRGSERPGNTGPSPPGGKREPRRSAKMLADLFQAVEAERQKDLQRQADAGSRRGGGGGGRPPVGRGDARNFSGGGQFGMPPPDNQRQLVGMDDIRRLGRGGSRQASQAGQPSLGPPSSMFGPRGSNTRRPLAPATFGKAADESGASSRTATPPAQKEKKEKEEKEAAAKHTNAFR